MGITNLDSLALGGTLSVTGASTFSDVTSVTDNLSLSGTLAVTGATTLTGAVTATAGVQSAAVARTATADGTGTGTIAAGTSYVTVTSANADHIIILPAPVVGNVIWLNVGANGFELRSSTPASIAINGGTGAGAESAIAANSTVLAVCISSTAWKAIYLDADSDVAKVEAAA